MVQKQHHSARPISRFVRANVSYGENNWYFKEPRFAAMCCNDRIIAQLMAFFRCEQNTDVRLY